MKLKVKSDLRSTDSKRLLAPLSDISLMELIE
jgi:hypothetical protein